MYDTLWINMEFSVLLNFWHMVYIFFYPCHPHLMFLNHPVFCLYNLLIELFYIKRQMISVVEK